MTKSIITGLGVLTVVTALLLWLAGVYEISSAGALALGFIGFVLTIFFARFGGFKPFFPAAEDVMRVAKQESHSGHSSANRSLVGVGAEADPSESLFGSQTRDPSPRPPVVRRVFSDDEGDVDQIDDEDSHETHPPLFGEALSEQLAIEHSIEDHITWPNDDDDDGGEEVESHSLFKERGGFVGSLRTSEAVAESAADVELEGSSTATAVIGVDRDSHRVAADTEAHVDPEEFGVEPSVDADIDIEELDAEELAASLDALEPADPYQAAAETDYVAEPVVTEPTGLAVASGTELPVVISPPTTLELHKYSSTEILEVVKTQEGVLVDTLIEEGVLSTSGPLTDKDIRTMVFVAVSSNELIDVLTQAQQEAVALNGGGEHALSAGD
jgi:hypothetical protein